MQQNKLFGTIFLIGLLLIGLVASIYPASHPQATEPFIAEDVVRILAASGLVLLMTPRS
jgi:hypothetical protein